MAENALVKERLTFFRKKKLFCHIITVKGYHYNGIILKQDDTHMLIDDKIEGEITILISDISTIEKSKRGDSHG